MDEPRIKVGICDGYPEIRGRLNGVYRAGGSSFTGEFVCRPLEGAVVLCDAFGRELLRGPEIRLTAERSGTFTLHEVTIGVRFHWERREEQTFPGDLTFLAAGAGDLAAVNELPVEEYLASVVSSEMSGEAPFAFLKAHAIASRSWLVAMLERRGRHDGKRGQSGATLPGGKGRSSAGMTARITTRFDVCADDHCQRYQGITGRAAREGGGGRPGDAGRLSDPGRGDLRRPLPQGVRRHDRGLRDLLGGDGGSLPLPRLRLRNAPSPRSGRKRMRSAGSSPVPTSTATRTIWTLLRRILPAFDRETADFFRWQVSYAREELEAILRSKSGIDFGVLAASYPLERGPSGRIRLLRIEGSKATVVVGKELEIRRWLSPSHLYSSAFIVRTTREPSGAPARFTLYGAGWGHGVGLCQIGAAVMAEKGFSAEEILRHYFRGAALVKRY